MTTGLRANTMSSVPLEPREPAMKPEEFAQLLQDAGLTIRDAAEILGVSNPTVSRWQTGKTPISKSSAKLIKALIKKPKK